MDKPKMEFTLGADPEMFIINEKTNKVISSIGIIPGEKGAPWTADDWPAGFGIEIDNILVEYNIPPVSNKEDWIAAINFMKSKIRAFVKNVNPDYNILCASSRMVDDNQLTNPIAKVFGCCPDFCIYTKSPNPKPKGEQTNLRSAGFHIHFGYDNPNIDVSNDLIRRFDVYVGLMSLLFDDDRKRRSLYGKAGCYRLCSYGFEYRTLSSKMAENDNLLGLIYDGVIASVISFEQGIKLPNAKDVQYAINHSDVKLARFILSMERDRNKNSFIGKYLDNVLNK